jgi:hypothetical protein
MHVRAYKESDLEELRAIHAAQGFGYEFPELSNPLFLTKLVLVEDGEEKSGREETRQEETTPGLAAEQSCQDGAQQCCAPTRIVGASLLRLTAEAYLLLDPCKGSPRERWQWLLAMHEATRREAWARGLADVHAWLPPAIAAKFGKRLTRLGWVRDDVWTPYCKRLMDGDG